uniref:Uncharacterized protein LOC108949425 n=1 Tax=Phallusia mammillata TaxID=59560 RepID=A0A6F9DJY1_9ASCI|nr:uncharacterized protein LOC108949425 [Phallusia mammillata]
MQKNVVVNTAVTSQPNYVPGLSTQARSDAVQSYNKPSVSNKYSNISKSIDLTEDYDEIQSNSKPTVRAEILPRLESSKSQPSVFNVSSTTVSNNIGANANSKALGLAQSFSKGQKQNNYDSPWRITEMKTAGEKSSGNYGNSNNVFQKNFGNTDPLFKNNFGNTAKPARSNFANSTSALEKSAPVWEKTFESSVQENGGLKNVSGSTGQVMWQNTNATNGSKYQFKPCGSGYNNYIQEEYGSGNNLGNTASSSAWSKYEEPSLPANARKKFLIEQFSTSAARPPLKTQNLPGDENLSRESCKRVTFEDEVNHTMQPCDENDVSIRCDFDLSDDDSLLMEACIQAEENMEMSEELAQIPPGPLVTLQRDQDRHPVVNVIHDTRTLDRESSSNVMNQTCKDRSHIKESPRSRDAEKQVRARKADELAEAERMFDSIFGAMF